EARKIQNTISLISLDIEDIEVEGFEYFSEIYGLTLMIIFIAVIQK
ncbi:16471_t:CDS:2, partial [Funneliformis geosporum]